jgi:16S rRNA processing protein RimM
VRVQAFHPEGPSLRAGTTVWLAGERRTIRRSRWDRDAWLMTLEGIATREAAEGLRGWLLERPDADVPRDDAESYFIHELVGLRVVDIEGTEVGRLAEVLTTGANDVYVVRGDAGEVLIPAIGEVVVRIDLPVGVMEITPLARWFDTPK